MKTQIPIYRAKKIDSGEYVIGWLANPTPSLFYIFYNHCGYLNVNNEVCIQENERAEIDPSTLAIHFPDMLDSEGTKIFASLSEDGKGGDTFKINGKDNTFDIFVAIFQGGNGLYLLNTTDNYRAKGAIHPVHRLITKVTGIYND